MKENIIMNSLPRYFSGISEEEERIFNLSVRELYEENGYNVISKEEMKKQNRTFLEEIIAKSK